MEKITNNKEKIFNIALKLFAEKSYSAVSMREIAKEVNIKAASIYNHYKSKEEILDAIVDYFREQLEKQVYPSFKVTESTDIHNFMKRTIDANNKLFMEPVLIDISRIIFKEQFQNEKIKALLLEELIQKPREAFTKAFKQMMESGRMRLSDPVLAAKEFHAYFIYRFYEISLMQEINQQTVSLDDESEQERHIQNFIDFYCIK